MSRRNKPTVNAVLIAGPTASGKSALALELAGALGGTVINADSMQVYRDLRIITARPDAGEEASAPHLLYGHRDAGENCSVGMWLADMEAALAACRMERRLPIVIGGTGLYFRALTRGLSAIPPIPAAIREAIRAQIHEQGPEALHAVLAARDPETAARLKPRDPVRIGRALEVLEATGRSITDWQRNNLPPLVDLAGARAIFLSPARQQLYATIDRRFASMIAQGALEEVEKLAARKLDPALPAMKAHGVPWLIRHLVGEITIEAAIDAAQADTRHYAKRQMTWFRHQLPEFAWMEPQAARHALLKGDHALRI